jgi:hypothetical protein
MVMINMCNKLILINILKIKKLIEKLKKKKKKNSIRNFKITLFSLRIWERVLNDEKNGI